MEALGLYALTLVVTVFVEAPLVAALCRSSGWRRAFGAAVAVNLASHPAATAFVSIAHVDWLLAELLVVALEASALRAALGSTPRRAWSTALVANALTAALALGWPNA